MLRLSGLVLLLVGTVVSDPGDDWVEDSQVAEAISERLDPKIAPTEASSRALDELLKESQNFAEEDSSQHSQESTTIQRGLRDYAGRLS